MDKLPRIAVITILVIMIGLCFCIVFLAWIFFEKNEQMTFDLNRYISVFFTISSISFVCGALFTAGQKSWNMIDFCGKINNSITANNFILLVEQRKKQLNDGIPDFIEVKIVTPPVIKK